MALLSRKVYDAIVIGAGGAAGSASLYQLAKRGANVLGLEAQPEAPHRLGSSHGNNSIIRLIYEEHPTAYMSLIRSAFKQWAILEKESGLELLRITGILNISGENAIAQHGHSIFDGAVATAKLHNLEHQILTAEELKAKIPALNVPNGYKALYDIAGGILNPDQSIRAFLSVAQQYGAIVKTNAPVKEWKIDTNTSNKLVQVTTVNGDVYQANRLVIAAGAWMPRLVPELAPLLAIERQMIASFKPVSDQASEQLKPDRFPGFLLDTDDNENYYGFPLDTDGLFTFGSYHLGQNSPTVDTLDRTIHPQDESTLRKGLEKYIPGANGPMMKAVVSMFTNTPDGHFILDHHPRYPKQVALCSACSGHGFKFSPVLGDVMADLVLNDNGETRYDISMHRIKRERQGHDDVISKFYSTVE